MIRLPSFEIRKRRCASSGIRHNPQPAIHHALLEQLAKSPPHRLHKRKIQRFIIVVEIDPPAHPLNGLPPFGRIPHDDLPALFIVLVNAHFHDIFLASDPEAFVYFVFYGQAVRIPAESTRYVVPADVGMSSHDILRKDLLDLRGGPKVKRRVHLP